MWAQRTNPSVTDTFELSFLAKRHPDVDDHNYVPSFSGTIKRRLRRTLVRMSRCAARFCNSIQRNVDLFTHLEKIILQEQKEI